MLCCYVVIFQSERDNSCSDGVEMLFDPTVITTLDWSRHKATFRGDISPDKPGPNLLARPLSVDDFDKGANYSKEAVAFRRSRDAMRLTLFK